MAAIIGVENLSKTGRQGAVCRALHEVVSRSTRAFVAFMGPSGSSKTTLLNIISTIDKPTQGRVIIAGPDTTLLRKIGSLRRDASALFSGFQPADNMTIQDNIATD